MVVVDGSSMSSITPNHGFLMHLGCFRARIRVERVGQYRAMLLTPAGSRVSYQQQISSKPRCRRRRPSEFLPYRHPVNCNIPCLACIGDVLFLLPGEHLISLVLFFFLLSFFRDFSSLRSILVIARHEVNVQTSQSNRWIKHLDPFA
jgi:hypothetical protein